MPAPLSGLGLSQGKEPCSLQAPTPSLKLSDLQPSTFHPASFSFFGGQDGALQWFQSEEGHSTQQLQPGHGSLAPAVVPSPTSKEVLVALGWD